MTFVRGRVVALAVATAIVVPLNAPQPAAAGPSPYTKVVFTAPRGTGDIAQAGSLSSPSQSVTLCVQAKNGNAGGADGAVINLSFFPGVYASGASHGGTARAGGTASASTALGATPKAFTVGGSCTDSGGMVYQRALTVTYTAPAVIPTSGRDVINGSATTSVGPLGSCIAGDVTCDTDVYVFSPVAGYAFSPGSAIAAAGSLTGGQAVSFTVTALDNSVPAHPVPGQSVILLFASTWSSHGTAAGVDRSGSRRLTSAGHRFDGDASGLVRLTYTAPITIPPGGVDTITAHDHVVATVTAATAYSYAVLFAPQAVGAPQVAVTPDGSQQLVFWNSAANNRLFESRYEGVWKGPNGFPQMGTLTSAPAVAVTKDGSQQLVFWAGPGGHLFEAWYSDVWNGPLDITATALGGAAILTSAPSVATTPAGDQLVFWRGADGHLWEAWYSDGHWHGPADYTTLGSLASAPSAAVTADGSQQLVFFQGTDNQVTEDWFAAGRWNGPAVWSGLGPTSTSPSVAVTPDGSQQLVFYTSPTGHLLESWFTGTWHGPLDETAADFGGEGLLTSAPSATVTPDNSQQIVFWQGAGATLWEAWYTAGRWNGPVNWSG